jgi:hypothetical protein
MWKPSGEAGENWIKICLPDLSIGFENQGADNLRLKKDPSIDTASRKLLKQETAGDPMSDQKWLRSSLRHLVDEMEKLGYWLSHTTIRRLLGKLGYSLKANEKRLAGSQHPDRNQQFDYIAAQKDAFRAQGLPIISVDTKKKS